MLNHQEFLNYFNSFYGKGGIYSSGRDITLTEIDYAISKIDNFEGDSLDREKACNIIFTQKEIDKLYS